MPMPYPICHLRCYHDRIRSLSKYKIIRWLLFRSVQVSSASRTSNKMRISTLNTYNLKHLHQDRNPHKSHSIRKPNRILKL